MRLLSLLKNNTWRSSAIRTVRMFGEKPSGSGSGAGGGGSGTRKKPRNEAPLSAKETKTSSVTAETSECAGDGSAAENIAAKPASSAEATKETVKPARPLLKKSKLSHLKVTDPVTFVKNELAEKKLVDKDITKLTMDAIEAEPAKPKLFSAMNTRKDTEDITAAETEQPQQQNADSVANAVGVSTSGQIGDGNAVAGDEGTGGNVMGSKTDGTTVTSIANSDGNTPPGDPLNQTPMGDVCEGPGGTAPTIGSTANDNIVAKKGGCKKKKPKCPKKKKKPKCAKKKKKPKCPKKKKPKPKSCKKKKPKKPKCPKKKKSASKKKPKCAPKKKKPVCKKPKAKPKPKCPPKKKKPVCKKPKAKPKCPPKKKKPVCKKPKAKPKPKCPPKKKKPVCKKPKAKPKPKCPPKKKKPVCKKKPKAKPKPKCKKPKSTPKCKKSKPKPKPKPKCEAKKKAKSSICKRRKPKIVPIKRAPICKPKPKPKPCKRPPPKVHSEATFWRKVSLFAGLPILLLLTGLVFSSKEERERPEFVPYTYLRLRHKAFPWGDGNHSLFHHKYYNALPEGYEDEIEENDDGSEEAAESAAEAKKKEAKNVQYLMDKEKAEAEAEQQADEEAAELEAQAQAEAEEAEALEQAQLAAEAAAAAKEEREQ